MCWHCLGSRRCTQPIVRDGHRLLLAAFGRGRRLGVAASFFGRCSPGVDRGRPHRRRAHGRVRATRPCRSTTTPRLPTRATTAAAGPRRPSSTVDADWRSGYYEVVLTIDVDGKTRRSHAFFVVRPQPAPAQQPILLVLGTNTGTPTTTSVGGTSTPAPPGVPAAADGARLPLQTAGAGRRVTSIAPTGPAVGEPFGYLALNHLSPYGGSAGWPDWELPFVRWAEREGYDVRRRHERRPRGSPGARSSTPCRLYLSIGHDEYWSARRCETPSRASSAAAATSRSCRATRRSGRSASRIAVRRENRAPRWSATRARSSTTRCSAPTASRSRPPMWSDHLLGRPENHMTGVSFTRAAITASASGSRTGPADTPFTVRALALRRHRPRLRRRARCGRDDRRLRVRRLRLHLPRRPAVPDGRGRHPGDFEILGTAPAAHFTRTTAARPPTPHEPAEDEFIAARPLRHAATRRPSSASPTATPCSARTPRRAAARWSRRARTDWVYGLAEPRPAGRADHPQHPATTGLDYLKRPGSGPRGFRSPVSLVAGEPGRQ